MILLRADEVGRLAYARLARDHAIAPLTPGTARPIDVPDSPGLRALAAAPRVPGHVVLTGLAALWVHGWLTAPPLAWHAVGLRGLYRPPGALVMLHSGVTARLGIRTPSGLALAPPPRACVDALRWEDPGDALPAAVRGLREGRIVPADLLAALACDPANGAGFARLDSLVRAVVGAATPQK
ncbi:hypothetical protein [Demequina soli]|uniref:hypothetical protein n=1 Tax=Demequina soli TaxID=1638987 RepID=UPI000785C00E|nr:hypothetical protein [Demequina soli]